MRTLLLLSIVFCFAQSGAHGQGCSDAGFCTAGALNATSSARDTTEVNAKSLGLSLTFGIGEQGTTIITPQLEWKHALTKNMQLEVRLHFYYASGNIGGNGGIGDPIITISNKIWHNKDWQLASTGGLRISPGDASKVDKGRPLPMPYQSNLGTTDIIAGLSLKWKHYLSFAIGLQQPVVQYNNNGYYAPDYPLESADYKSYFNSRKLVRKGDVLFRADGRYSRKKFDFAAGPLLIVHLGEDRITATGGQEINVAGSDGATLNLTGSIGYRLPKARIELSAGSPFAVREVRPDGLTRSGVLTLRYEHFLR